MLIDWFTVGAQIVNFLVLVWLLQRYLYRPVLAAMDARDKDIAERRAAVVTELQQAQKDREDCKHQKETLEQQRAALISTAQQDAKTEGARLLQEVAEQADKLRATRCEELDDESAKYRGELIDVTRQEIIAVTRKVLSDLASHDLEGSTVEAFLRRLAKLPVPTNTDAVSSSANGPACAIRLRSAFALSPDQQGRVKEQVLKKFGNNDLMEFETVPAMGLGLELVVHDQKVAWNIDGYLASFEAELAGKKAEAVVK